MGSRLDAAIAGATAAIRASPTATMSTTANRVTLGNESPETPIAAVKMIVPMTAPATAVVAICARTRLMSPARPLPRRRPKQVFTEL